MKLFLASALALLVVLSGCKSSNPPPAPESAQGGITAQPSQVSPRDAGAPPPTVDAGSVADAGAPADAGSTVDAGAEQPAADAGTEEAESTVPTDTFAEKLIAEGCSYDPGSEQLRGLAAGDSDGEKLPGGENYQEAFDCAPDSEFDQNCAYDPCWGPMETCKQKCNATCVDCKQECQPACDTCLSGCDTDECKVACAETTEACLKECQTPRLSCRDACESTYRECSSAAQERWARECAEPCEANTACEERCDENPGKQGEVACKAKCPDLPDSCIEECASRNQ